MVSERLNEIIKIVTSNSEETMDDFLELMKPEKRTRVEMGENFVQVIGYDPTTYYDKQTLHRVAQQIRADENTPDEVVSYIEKNEDKLVDRAYEIFADLRDATFLPAAVEQAIEEETGVRIDIEEEEDSDDDGGYDSESYDDDDDFEDD